MCNNKRFISTLIFIITFFTIAFSQKDISNPKDSKDPNALGLSENIMGLSNTPSSQFGKPVIGSSDLYTGMATYQIPLFELKSYMLKIPVALSYASGGVKVGETGGWLGISWQLNAGGEISREMKAYPDELPEKGYFVHGDMPNSFENKSIDEKIDIIKKSQQENNDMQPDVFHYSFAGGSGYFVFDNEQNIHLVPYKNWKISKTVNSTSKKITSFEVITDDGTKYTFGKEENAIEETKLSTLSATAYWDFSGTTAIPKYDEQNMSEKPGIDDFYTSKWYLIEIESQTKDKITIEYDDAGLLSYVNAPQIMSYESMTGLQYDIVKDPYFGNLTEAVKPHQLAYKKIIPKWYDDKPSSFPYACNPNDLQYLALGCPVRPDGTGTYYNPSTNEDLPCLVSGEQGVVSYPLRYFLHQTKVEIKSKIISKIKTSNNNYVQFVHDASSTIPGTCRISKVVLKDMNNKEIKSFILQYKKVISNSANPSGAAADPFSLMEFMAFRDAKILKTGSGFVPANLAKNYFDIIVNLSHQDLYTHYVFEGLKEYNYERFFLERLQESSNQTSIQPYVFTYKSPESIIRRTSVWSGVFNYSIAENIDPSQIFCKMVESYNYQVADGLSKPIGTSYGQLQKIFLPTGGYVQYEYEDTKEGSEIIFGSKRVAKITQSDGINSYAKKITYPVIGYKALWRYHRDIDFYDPENLMIYKKIIRTSYELDETDFTKGSPVGYKVVTVENCSDISEQNCNSSNGYEQYEFTTLDDIDIVGLNAGNKYGKSYAYPILTGFNAKCVDFQETISGDNKRFFEISPTLTNNFTTGDYKNFSSIDNIRGLMKKQTVYSATGKISETKNDYKLSEYSNVTGLNGLSYNYGFYYVKGDKCFLGDCWNKWDPYDMVRQVAYLSIHRSTSVSLTSTTEKTFDMNYPGNESKAITNVKEYQAHSTILKPIEEKAFSVNSTGTKISDELKTKFRYTDEFTQNLPIQMMHENNMLIPIEVTNYKNDQIIGSSITSYFINAGNMVLPVTSYTLETNEPLAIANFQPATSSMVLDSKVKPKGHFDQYDNKGNLLQYHQENGINVAFVWAYKQTYPVAKIENSTYDNVINTLGSIGSSNNDIESKSIGDDDETDLLKVFNDLRGTTLMADAIITSYTYNPLVGMTSQTDASGKTTYYDYDGLGRLKTLGNQNKEILKSYEYHYKPAETGTFSDLGFTGISGATTYKMGDNATFNANITSGSGSYTYKWELMENGVSFTNYTAPIFNINLSAHGNYEVACTVTDTKTGQSINRTMSITVSIYLIAPEITGPSQVTSSAAGVSVPYYISNAGDADSVEIKMPDGTSDWISYNIYGSYVPVVFKNPPTTNPVVVTIQVRIWVGGQASPWGSITTTVLYGQ